MIAIKQDTAPVQAVRSRTAPERGLLRQRGLTLIEAATVLAILAFVVAGIMMLYTGADQSRKTTAALSDLANIQGAVRSVFGGQSTYAGATNTNMIASNALATKMVSSGAIRNSFNGGVTILAANAGGGPDSGFSVQFDNIPKDPCVKLAVADLGRGTYSVQVGSVTRSQTSSPALPFNPAAAAAACTSNSSNSIIWIFN